jgi:hypothetical protein
LFLLFLSLSISDPKKFLDHAKRFIDHLKKHIELPKTTTNSDQNNPYRVQVVELCKDILEEKSLELNQDDERHYRLLATETLSPMKILSAHLNEFVRWKELCSLVSAMVVFHSS